MKKGKAKPVPEGYHTATPYLIVDGAAKALDFYQRAFGATERMRMPGPGGKIGHDFFRTFERLLWSTMIAAVVAIPPDRAGQNTCRRRVSVIHSGDFRLPCTAAMQSNGA